jgi:glutamine synthetase
VAQRNYHQSFPYLHGRAIADEILRTVAEVTGCVKYCHGEVGYIDRIDSHLPELDDKRVEQYEIEFDLVPIEDLGTWLAVARWLVRAIAAHHGASVTYLPKLEEGMAGSGLHFHLALTRDGRNVMVDEKGELTEDALRIIGGLLRRSPELTAFGNTVAASYLRLVPGQEAPTLVCWGRHNRSSLIRVPLDFRTDRRLDLTMNPDETGDLPPFEEKATVEYRSPDGSAFYHLLLAAIAMAIEEGLTSEDGLAVAERLEVVGNLAEQDEVRKTLEALPTTAEAAAAILRERRSFFEDRGFSPRLVDLILQKLENEADDGLSERLRKLPAADRLKASRSLMHKDLHKH